MCLPVREDSVALVMCADGLCDVVCKLSGHLHGVNEVRGVFQDGVVTHEVCGAHISVVVFEIHGSAVRRMTTALNTQTHTP